MKNHCKCNQPGEGYGGRERPRFFPHQLITDEELTAGQEYFRNKLRLHNRMIHGWGVVCGALVCLKLDDNGDAEPWKVVVKPGYVLGPYGDDILIECDHEVDLRSRGSTSEWGAEGDPWCSEVYEKPEDGPICLAVKYRQTPARPVRVEPLGCGCDDSRCEYSRWKDGYEIGFLDGCPESHQNPPDPARSGKSNPECPVCPDTPWVVLACIQVDSEGVIESIDNCSCRRLVASFGNFWWQCEESEQKDAVVVEEVRPETRELVVGNRSSLVVTGGNFTGLTKARVSLGSGVEIVKISPSRKSMRIEFRVAPDANPGDRVLTIERADGSKLEHEAFLVKEKVATTPSKDASNKPSTKKTSPAPSAKPKRTSRKEEKDDK